MTQAPSPANSSMSCIMLPRLWMARTQESLPCLATCTVLINNMINVVLCQSKMTDILLPYSIYPTVQEVYFFLNIAVLLLVNIQVMQAVG
ncbi:MAG: hypothetical protein ACTS73_09215 [Arsenophonus sp. NEOnobi-MAG3]